LPNAKHKNKFQMEIITTLDYLPRGTYSWASAMLRILRLLTQGGQAHKPR
jgi:hypothetical protein